MGNTFAAWESANHCSGGSTPGALRLLAAIVKRFPLTHSDGIYNCRPVRGTVNTFSHHAEGRAIDVACDIDTGRKIVALIGSHGRALGVDELIHNRRIYSAKTPGGRSFNGPSHTDHVHIGLTRKAGANLTTAAIDKILGGGTSSWPLTLGRRFGFRAGTRGRWRLLLVDRGTYVRRINVALGFPPSSLFTKATRDEVIERQKDARWPVNGMIAKREWDHWVDPR